ncbi:unnamed protein product [Cladocopium goreaui]|uniref:RING-type E3 ubiquitin transferase n=2 Tax=Cladocopium goreaui TaxID=2562237 RepID=A0A9P1CCJ6_9DINO|nr:unnamed protein product [Cladocopium goreaui]
MVDYSRFDHIDTSDSEADEPAAWRNVSGPGANPGASQGPPANVMEDLEDYFHRVDARRAEIEAEMATDGDSMGMPSVERFEDADFQALARRNLESAAECAICLANVEVGEEAVQLPCAARHTFHDDCAREWLSRNVTCPLCRVDVRALVRSERRGPAGDEAAAAPGEPAPGSPRAFGYTRDGGLIMRYDPRPPPEEERPPYIPPELHSVAELVEIEYPERGTARIWRVPRRISR